MKKIILSLLILGIAFCSVSNAVEGINATTIKDMKVGDEIIFADRVYILLNPSEGLVVSKNIVTKKAFDEDNTNKYDLNDINNIAYWLNNDFYNSFTDEQKKIIKSSIWYTGPKENEKLSSVQAHIGLLSYSQYFDIAKKELDTRKNRGWWWYLITPRKGHSDHVMQIHPDGNDISFVARVKRGIRPTFRINETQSMFKVKEGVYKAEENISEKKVNIIIDMSNADIAGLVDVKESDWFYETVKLLTDEGVISGYLDGTFKPKGNIRYDEFLKMLVMAEELDYYKSRGIVEVTEENWDKIKLKPMEKPESFYWGITYILHAYKGGIIDKEEYIELIEGKSKEYINRDDMALYSYKAIGKEEKTIIKNENDKKAYKKLVNDIDKAENVDELLEMYAKGVISGYSDGTFKPNKNITRAEACVIVSRIFNNKYRAEVKKPELTEENDNVSIERFIEMIVTSLGYNDIEMVEGDWSANYIKKAKEVKIINISNRDSFLIRDDNWSDHVIGNRFSETITKEEAYILLFNTLKHLKETGAFKYDEERNAFIENIKENEKMSLILKTSISEVWKKGIMIGNDDGSVGLNEPISRKEANDIANRLINKDNRVAVNLTINEEKENYNIILPKNYYDFYQIDPKIPTWLYEMEFNQKSDAAYFLDNILLWEKPYSWGWMEGETEVMEAHKSAIEFVEAIYNYDYVNGSLEEWRSKIEPVISTNADSILDEIYQKFVDKQIISEAEFITDTSLVYSEGQTRVRGILKLKYISNEKLQYYTPETDYNDIKGMEIELNKWYEIPLELQMKAPMNPIKWKQNKFIFRDEISIK